MHVSAYAHGGQRCQLELAMQAVGASLHECWKLNSGSPEEQCVLNC